VEHRFPGSAREAHKGHNDEGESHDAIPLRRQRSGPEIRPGSLANTSPWLLQPEPVADAYHDVGIGFVERIVLHPEIDAGKLIAEKRTHHRFGGINFD